jgi:Fur family ferric uptake transcriptional regulator
MSDTVVRQKIRSAGLRVTPARVAVLRALEGAGGPTSHAEVSEALQGEGWDRATLYRNLVDLTEVGLLRRVDLGDHVWRFELTSVPDQPGHEADHPHFLCTSCGDVTCLPEVRFAGALPTSRPVSIQLRGICEQCSA